MADEQRGFFRGLMDKLTGGSEEPAANEATSPASVPPTVGTLPREQNKPGMFERLKQGLSKTRESLVGRIDSLLFGKKQIDADTLTRIHRGGKLYIHRLAIRLFQFG